MICRKCGKVVTGEGKLCDRHKRIAANETALVMPLQNHFVAAGHPSGIDITSSIKRPKAIDIKPHGKKRPKSFDIKPYDKKGYVFIASTPCSGTQFIAKTFQAIGVDIQHEKFGIQGISAFCIVPYLVSRENGIIIHQTRETLKVISSMQVISRKTWQIIFNSMGIHYKQHGLTHALMRLYLRLNSEIDKCEHFRYKVEDINDEWAQLLDIMGLPNRSLPDIPTNTHTRAGKYTSLTWDELEVSDAELTKHIKDMGCRYGYEVE